MTVTPFCHKVDRTVDKVTADDNENTSSKNMKGKKRNGDNKSNETQSRRCYIHETENMVPRREIGFRNSSNIKDITSTV
jgi:hypothetical protein